MTALELTLGRVRLPAGEPADVGRDGADLMVDAVDGREAAASSAAVAQSR